jgi:thioredoxin 1
LAMRLHKPWIAPLRVALLAVLPAPNRAAVQDIYPAPERANADVAAALESAAASHRRVIVDFGGNWCPDCHVLDLYFHDATNKPILEANYILVHVNIGRADQFHTRDIPNHDIAERYRIPLDKGVPALVVLDTDGTLLYSQTSGEFEAMRHMQTDAVTEFLTKWKLAATK